ncbi:hypothetical protein B0O79_0230 [Flavobacteriaceae bacterium MAR_2009_75]|nr:hypothetical protein B0O79_0230 [Flavobacteriaceae bacterium MAR_2009_75]
MKKTILFISIISLFAACSSIKQAQKSINTGNYENAIHTSIDNLAKNKTKKANQPYIVLLEQAYIKHTERELERIDFLENDENPAHYEAIYNSFVNLKAIQNKIKALLPLYIAEENRQANFEFNDYQDAIIDSKDDLAEFLYDNASNLLANATNKRDYRKAYDDFEYLDKIEPGYDDVKRKIEEAYAKGLDYISVDLVNETEQIIPARLEEELLNFNIYGLEDFWTKYHNNTQADVIYDYNMKLALRQINISPERISEKQLVKERQVKDGYKYAVNRDGSIVKDSLGNKVKIDKFKTVSCNFYEFTQFKTAAVSGLVQFTDLKTKQQLSSYPLASEFIFEHIYANYDGDKRAIDNDQLSLLKLKAIPFPSNEQMVYDAGEDLKAGLKSILRRQKFD